MIKMLKKIRKDRLVNSDVLGLRDAQMSGHFDSDSGQMSQEFVITSNDTVIDVGCGSGGYAKFAAEQGAEVIVTDIVEANVNQTLKKLKSSSASSFEGYVSDSDPLPIESNRCSRIICTEVLEHVQDPQKFMAELVRVGRPGALYLLTVPDPASEAIQESLAPQCYWEAPNHLRIYAREEFDSLVTESGLHIEKKSYKGFFWSIWWALFWGSEQELGDADGPLLRKWVITWDAVLKSRDGERIKNTMDSLMPKSQVIVARKPE